MLACFVQHVFLCVIKWMASPKVVFITHLSPRCNNNLIPSWHLGLDLQALMNQEMMLPSDDEACFPFPSAGQQGA